MVSETQDSNGLKPSVGIIEIAAVAFMFENSLFLYTIVIVHIKQKYHTLILTVFILYMRITKFQVGCKISSVISQKTLKITIILRNLISQRLLDVK